MSHNLLSQSSIDFLKSCSTGVNLVPGFSSVHYWVYTAQPLPNPPNPAEVKSVEDALLEAEITIRDRRDILYCDAQRNSIWFFAGASDSTPIPHPELEKGRTGIEKHGWAFRIVFSGMFTASELSFYSSKLAPSHFQAPGQSQVPIPNLSAAANARASQQIATSSVGLPGNGTAVVAYDRNDLRAIYDLFIRAVQSCFAYTLAKNCKALQLDARSFVYVEDEIGGMKLAEDSLPLTVFAIDHSLANGGGMLVSTSIMSSEELYLCTNADAYVVDSSEVIIAPGGLSARVLADHAAAVDSASVRQWKASVRTRLRSRGIDVEKFDSKDRWLLLKAHGSHPATLSLESTTFYWPMALCFMKRPQVASFEPSFDIKQETSAQISEERSGLYWFETPNQDGYKEPLRAAEDWYNTKAVRDKVVDERRRREETAKQQAENPSTNVTSPQYVRDGLQATAGVYPTPPDGLLSQLSNAQPAQDVNSVSLPVDQLAYRGSLDMQHSELMDLDMGPFEDSVHQRPSLVSRGSLDAAMKMGGEDLFGDLEDEDLRGQDVTDADFSFFDEPEVPEAMLIDRNFEKKPKVSKREDADVLTSYHGGNIKPRVDTQLSPANDTSKDGLINYARNNESIELGDSDEEIKDTPMNGTEILSGKQDLHEPLDPTSLRRKLFEFAITSPSIGRRVSHFEPLPFNAMLQQNDAKYNSNGAFAYKPDAHPLGSKLSATAPRIKPRPPDRRDQKLPIPPRLSITSPDQATLFDSDSSSDSSDISDEDPAYRNGFRSLASSPMKGMFQEGNGNIGDDVLSVPGSSLLMPQQFSIDSAVRIVYRIISESPSDLLTIKQRQAQVLNILLHSPSTSPRPWTTRPLLPFETQRPKTVISRSRRPPTTLLETEGTLNPFHKDFINVAQIIAEQLSLGFVNDSSHPTLESRLLLDDVTTTAITDPTRLKSIITVIRSCCTTMSQCDLLDWLCVPESVPEKPNLPKGHPPVLQKKAMISGLQTSDGGSVPASALSPLYPPHVRVRRNEGFWDVLPPALPFWEQLGLAPAACRKNVMAFCVYPGNNDLRSQCSIFMDYLGATFESCKLGAHVRATQAASITNGLVPVGISTKHALQPSFNAVHDVCVELGKLLAGIESLGKVEFTPAIDDISKIDAFVIYMVNPYNDDNRGLMELCASFWALYETYRQAVTSPMLRTSQPDVVLQILPIHYVADPHAPVIMESAFYQKLAREVYDRCPPATSDRISSRLPIESAPAVQLEQPLPRKIDFKLQADPPPDLLHEGSNLHLGYAKSSNGEWVSVAWTDGTGKYQASASYCLLGGRTFVEVARVIWQSTLEIMQARRVAWRLCIARVGALEKEELDGRSSRHPFIQHCY
jgi:mediator of RNA polymerase II transcription subunit 13